MGWMLVRRYQHESAARTVYEAARDLLFTQDLDASVLRFSVNRSFHVALIGDVPLTPAAQRALDALLDRGGEPVELPPFAADDLRERRAQFKESGIDYYERRTDSTPPLP